MAPLLTGLGLIALLLAVTAAVRAWRRPVVCGFIPGAGLDEDEGSAAGEPREGSDY